METPVSPSNESANAPNPLVADPKPEPVTRNASWGAIISITIILAMIIIGAFYSWGQRLAQQHPQAATSETQ